MVTKQLTSDFNRPSSDEVIISGAEQLEFSSPSTPIKKTSLSIWIIKLAKVQPTRMIKRRLERSDSMRLILLFLGSLE